jgi:hypothetical protein
MAAVTTAVVAGASVLLTVYGQQEQKKAALKAAKLNAQDAEENARLTTIQAAEDARQFRLSFRRDQAKNVAAIGASGIKQEGSPLEVLQDNASMAEKDYQNIVAGGEQRRASYMRQARMYRQGGAAAARSADIQSAASILKGANDVYSTGQKSGAWE